MKKATILVIDDDASILSIFSRTLASKGYAVVTSSTGEEGIDLARRHLPDLILCDINMPGIDGRGVLAAVRRDPELGTTQFVLMTGRPDDVTPRQGMEIGADDFLVKPFGIDELLSCIEARLNRAQIHWRVEDRVIDSLRADLGRTLPHEFITPLAGIVGIANILRLDWKNLEHAEIESLLESLEKSGWRMERTVRKYLMILKLDSRDKRTSASQDRLDGQQVQATVGSVTESVAQRWERVPDLDAEIAAVPLAIGEKDLSLIVEELVDNAFSFSKKGSAVQVSLSAEGVFQVADQGRGMAESQLQQLHAFRQFGRREHEQQGLGLGLVLVKRLASRCGAALDITSQQGMGTRSSVRFRTADSGTVK